MHCSTATFGTKRWHDNVSPVIRDQHNISSLNAGEPLVIMRLYETISKLSGIKMKITILMDNNFPITFILRYFKLDTKLLIHLPQAP